MYCDVSDLSFGDLIVTNDHIDKEAFIARAADEMNAKLGFIYKLPIHKVGGVAVETAYQELPVHEVLLLKTINARLASGRAILALAAAGEDTQLHAYGNSLVQEALADLMALANGVVDLSATRLNLTDDALIDHTPTTSNLDDESLLLGFEKNVMGVPGPRWVSRTGEVL